MVQLDIGLVTHLLECYLKPLFSCTPSSSINASTGRAAKGSSRFVDSTDISSRAALMEDEIIWKGGDVESAAKKDLFGSRIVFDVDCKAGILQRRHRGLGSCNVLYICCCSIQALKIGTYNSWEQYWPLVLPPLLILLEDSSPIYRLLGSRILNTTLLRAKNNTMTTGTLLLRSGVATLFRQNLEASLTFISAKLSAPLLQSAAESLILLSQCTTADLRTSLSPSSHVVQDGGRERFSQLGKLIDEGVLRVWAYAPASLSSLQESREAPTEALLEDDIELREAIDVVDASIVVISRLTQDDALGIGVARYLDVGLEFLTAQLMGLENKLERRKDSKRGTVSLQREVYSAKAIEALLVVCKAAPGVRIWSSRCLDGVVRCWTLLQDRQINNQIRQLFAHLDGIVAALSEAQPDLMQKHCRTLLDLDEHFFAPLVGKIL
ncbi:hypothetical protein CBS101457_001101 [Exobasidium rhododendri]|nr:hypothetical protein CBS101457_001101 [Exobasidium rhododendri]